MKPSIPRDVLFTKLCEGASPKEIANKTGCHYVTVRSSIARYMKAMGARTRDQAIAMFTREKLKEEI